MANSLTFFPELFTRGYVDTLQKNVQIFNESTNGAITMAAQDAQGHIVRDKFFKRPSNLVSNATRGDLSEASTVDITEDEIKAAQIDRLVGPVEMGELEQLAADRTDEEFSEEFGGMVAEQVFEEYAESVISGVVGALLSKSGDLMYKEEDGSGNLKTVTPNTFNKAKGLFGDQKSDLAMLVMPGKVHTDLIEHNIQSADDPLVDAGAFGGTAATTGLPFILSDLDALDAGTGYYSAILRQGGAKVREVDQPDIVQSDNLFKNQGITQKIGADFRFYVRVQGFSFDDTVSNPTKSELADSSNWTFKMTDDASAAGVLIHTA